MGIDFSDMLNGEGEDVLHPRDIFFTLNRQSQFSFPRDIQTEVMNQWFERRDEVNSVIKLNVGSGKTIVGLLLLQSSLNEGKGPALYVAPDIQLAKQVIKEAEALGLDVTDDPRDGAYAAGERICVVNVYKLFNGLSVFGVGRSDINIGSVIIDDAHACVSTITKQFRISIRNNHNVYSEVISIISEDLIGYNQSRFLEIKDGDPRAYMEVPFWTWHERQEDILRVLHKYRSDDNLKFVYPLLKELLHLCRCIVGGQFLEIEPLYPATDLIQSFRRAKRRIYMTATLSDDSVLATHFGADPEKLGQPIVPSSSQSMGERMILMPQELNPELTLMDVQGMLKQLSCQGNVVVIVPSELASQEWENVADQILIGDNVPEGVELLRSGHVGLTILVNRYDGIDLPGNACRVLAIVDLPEVNSGADLVDSEVLDGSSVNLRRHVERIEQGMGRGVRSNDDFCAVLLLGTKLTSRLRSPEGQAMLTSATRAQLNLSRQIAQRLNLPSTQDIIEVILQCLARDPNWVKVSKKVLVNLKGDDALRFDSAKLTLRSAFDNVRSNQHPIALATVDQEIDQTSDDQIKAWLLSRKAIFEHPMDAAAAQRTIAAAHRLEPAVTKPMHGTTYKQLTAAVGQQAALLIANHQARFMDSTDMKLFADDLCNDLQFKPETADLFEAAVNELAFFLGICGQRPERQYKEGPDNLWALPNGDFLIIECKNGVTAGNGISKKDAGQLGQSVEWFKERYAASSYLPIMIHPERILGQAANQVSLMFVIEHFGLEKLRNNLRGFARQLVDPNVAKNATEVAARLAQFELNGEAFVNAFAKPPK
ncbi:DEAD/DEAH box helicase [Pseudovibrio sp. FO-BEG1]|uniref:DEAD/DEAH box helicase n=1 Tax=Pseudovibrio sp. (strain FO-BEG1) TaxID=911045 RepID=UPI0002F40BC3|nr:DEAD/DEAH box helicase [Pseudovibrio sp. FO-BEG1]